MKPKRARTLRREAERKKLKLIVKEKKHDPSLTPIDGTITLEAGTVTVVKVQQALSSNEGSPVLMYTPDRSGVFLQIYESAFRTEILGRLGDRPKMYCLALVTDDPLVGKSLELGKEMDGQNW